MDWEELVAASELQFQKLCALDQDDPMKDSERAAALREWWSITNAMLWMFVRTKAQTNAYLEPFPMHLLARLANIAEELSNGNVSQIITDVAVKNKGRPRWRAERHALAYAVYYIEAADRGEIADPTPRKTVRQAFNVTAQAVRNWLKDRDDICIGVPIRSFDADRLAAKMKSEGAVYSVIGRGAPSE